MDQPASHDRQLVPDTSRKVRTFAGLAFCLLFPSAGVIQKYFGNPGLLIYLVAATAILWLAYRYLAELVLLRLSERESVYLVLLTFVALVAIFAIVYPKANVHIAGHGSDADDGLNLAVNELLNGRYPYSARTYLDNPISAHPLLDHSDLQPGCHERYSYWRRLSDKHNLCPRVHVAHP